jgi:hypothetical protein
MCMMNMVPFTRSRNIEKTDTTMLNSVMLSKLSARRGPEGGVVRYTYKSVQTMGVVGIGL